MSRRALRLILNGKAAGHEPLRGAIAALREAGHCIAVRLTWEHGDALRWVAEADPAEVVVAAGGDGTVNEVVRGLMDRPERERPALGIVPLGTANDFATGCAIPADPTAALQLCATGAPVPIDVGRANDHWFINVASSGFGAEVTANTPPELKRLLGGAAYTLMGAILAMNFKPAQGRLLLPEGEISGSSVVAIISNGRQTGGGKPVAPRAFIDDGLLDVLIIRPVPATGLLQAVRELQTLGHDGEYIFHRQTPWVEFHPEQPTAINLDGEPVAFDRVRYEVAPRALRLIVPPDCPVLVCSRKD
jgi:lipid kinase YegS